MNLVESRFIAQKLDLASFEVEDFIELWPLHGKKQTIPLNRVQIDLVSKDNFKFAGKYYKEIETLKGDSVFIRIRQVETKSYASKYRVIIESMNSRPFLFNDSLVLKAVLKNEDKCDLAHNILKFKKKEGELTHLGIDQKLLDNQKIIKSKMNILLEGETGTGKTTLAKKIHEYSSQSGPFIHINLSAFSPTILESELFGHTKGAFTGAIHEKKGAFRQAHGGTLFLDEVDSIPIELQTKLLLFLDNSNVRPVGGFCEYHIDTRLIFASGSNLLKKVEQGLMRKDFYFRLQSGYRYELESLRSNPSNIEKFCIFFSKSNNLVIEKKLIDFYKTLPWPGNIRHLASHLERKKITANSSLISFDTCDDELIIQSSELSMLDTNEYEFMSLKQMKEAYAKKVYFKLNCNFEKASKVLGISSKSLRSFVNAS